MKIPILPLLKKNMDMQLGKDFIKEMNDLGKARQPFLFIIDFEGLSPEVYRLTDVPDTISYKTPGYQNTIVTGVKKRKILLKKSPVPYIEYLTAFNHVLHHLKQGNSYLVNLTFPTPIETILTLDEIFEFSQAPFKLLLKDQFVVFSPEPFIRIRDGVISSFPMKGTIDASFPEAGCKLLADPKEAAEHVTIVDLIRNDLSKVASKVTVARYRYIDRIRTIDKEILQASSEIRGILPDDYWKHTGDILAALLPAGSISGAPKKRTIEIIMETETVPRGFYTGVFGVFDGQNMESAVMIRFIEQTTDGLLYRSGGGVTHLSNPEAEYREMIDKVYLPIKPKRT